MKWTSGKVKPNHYESYIITTDDSVYYTYYDSVTDCFYLKSDSDVYGSTMIPRSEVNKYASIIEIYLDSKIA